MRMQSNRLVIVLSEFLCPGFRKDPCLIEYINALIGSSAKSPTICKFEVRTYVQLHTTSTTYSFAKP